MLLICTALTGAAFLYIMNYNGIVEVAGAMAFGSIVSATDPVAVIALLKELGAS